MKWGFLQKTIKIKNEEIKLKTDFRNAINTLSAFQNDKLLEIEKVEILFLNLLGYIPCENLEEYIEQLIFYLTLNKNNNNKNEESLIYFELDENYIFSSIINKYKIDIRCLHYLHYHSFLGYLQNLENTEYHLILKIRQKLSGNFFSYDYLSAKEKKIIKENNELELFEKIYLNENPHLFNNNKYDEKAEERAKAFFDEIRR